MNSKVNIPSDRLDVSAIPTSQASSKPDTQTASHDLIMWP